MKNKLAKLTAVTLAASMVIGSSVTGMAASTNQTSEREVRNAQLSKEAAEEGMVLLENENHCRWHRDQKQHSLVQEAMERSKEEQDPGMYTTVTQSPFMMH